MPSHPVLIYHRASRCSSTSPHRTGVESGTSARGIRHNPPRPLLDPARHAAASRKGPRHRLLERRHPIQARQHLSPLRQRRGHLHRPPPPRRLHLLRRGHPRSHRQRPRPPHRRRERRVHHRLPRHLQPQNRHRPLLRRHRLHRPARLRYGRHTLRQDRPRHAQPLPLLRQGRRQNRPPHLRRLRRLRHLLPPPASRTGCSPPAISRSTKTRPAPAAPSSVSSASRSSSSPTPRTPSTPSSARPASSFRSSASPAPRAGSSASRSTSPSAAPPTSPSACSTTPSGDGPSPPPSAPRAADENFFQSHFSALQDRGYTPRGRRLHQPGRRGRHRRLPQAAQPHLPRRRRWRVPQLLRLPRGLHRKLQPGRQLRHHLHRLLHQREPRPRHSCARRPLSGPQARSHRTTSPARKSTSSTSPRSSSTAVDHPLNGTPLLWTFAGSVAAPQALPAQLHLLRRHRAPRPPPPALPSAPRRWLERARLHRRSRDLLLALPRDSLHTRPAARRVHRPSQSRRRRCQHCHPSAHHRAHLPGPRTLPELLRHRDPPHRRA